MRHLLSVCSMFCLCLMHSACGDSDNNSENEDQENNLDACVDGVDNDEDGAVDCDDAECHAFCDTGKKCIW